MSRKRMFRDDYEQLRQIVDTTNALTNACADRSAEYYRRYQIEADGGDLSLTNLLHGVVNDLKKIETKIGEGSILDEAMSKRVAEEPGWFGRLIGRKGRESSGSSQTQTASHIYSGEDWAQDKEGAA